MEESSCHTQKVCFKLCYFARELAISKSLGLPALVIACTDSPLPNAFKAPDSFVGCVQDNLPPNYMERFTIFLDDARAIRPRYDSSTFFAHEY